ncbi:MAG TPA: hypothetical protein DCS63_09800 [Elusimicrobia bacterium]|nr:hypothetical protein [Elusimicrobiota bacterium]
MEFKYIKDQEINLEGHDLLGTLPYAETLHNIITNCDTPFTIGLLGGWGTGKSSIIKTLEEKFGDDSKIKVFRYDAWKYSKDSFRRTFLLQLKDFFKLDATSDLNKFYTDRHEEIDHNVHINKKWWLVPIALSPLALLLFNFSTEISLTQKAVFSLIGVFLTAGAFILKETFIEYKISVTKPHVFTPEQFDGIFKDIIGTLIPANRPESWIKGFLGEPRHITKLVIVIDNIDRCEKNLALELLLTVKNFLEIENVVFIIPVDDLGLGKYIQMSHKDKNEFLRKLFNATIKIKEFSPTEMLNFCMELNDRHALKLPKTTISIITQEYSKNPRRIIQFINTFLTERQVLANQLGSDFDANNHENLDALAKIIIIREEWPELYAKLLDDPKFIQRLNYLYAANGFELDEKSMTWKVKADTANPTPTPSPISSLTLSDEQHRFFMRTAYINTDGIENFILNRNLFGDIPHQIDNLIISQDWDSLKKQVKNQDITLDRLLERIEHRLDEDVVKNQLYATSGNNILALVLKIYSDPEYKNELVEKYSRGKLAKIESLLNPKQMRSLLVGFDAAQLVSFSLFLEQNGINRLSRNIITTISGNATAQFENKKKLLFHFISGFKDREDYLKQLSATFSYVIATTPNDFTEYNPILEASHWRHLLNDQTLIQLANTLPPTSAAEIQIRATIFQRLSALGVSSIAANNVYVAKVSGFLQTAELNNLANWLSPLTGVIDKVSQPIAKSLSDVMENRFTNVIIPQYTRSNNVSAEAIKAYCAFLDVAKELYLLDRSARSCNWLKTFLNTAVSSKVMSYANTRCAEIVDATGAFNWEFAQTIIDKCITPPNDSVKTEFAETINKMLLMSTDTAGISDAQAQKILAHYLALAKGATPQGQSAKQWLITISKSQTIKTKLSGKVASEGDLEQRIKLIPLIKEIDTELYSSFVHKTLEELTSDKIIQNHDLMNAIAENSNLLEDGTKTLLVGKVFPIFADLNTEKRFFAINILSKMENIPSSNHRKIKGILDDMPTTDIPEVNRASYSLLLTRINS